MASKGSFRVSDRLIVFILMGILAVLSFVVIVGNRDASIAAREARDAARRAQEAVVRTDIISECFTPNTRCSRFREESEAREQAYFRKLVEDASICTLLTSRSLRQTDDLAHLEQVYRQCVLDRTPPPPPPSIDE